MYQTLASYYLKNAVAFPYGAVFSALNNAAAHSEEEGRKRDARETNKDDKYDKGCIKNESSVPWSKNSATDPDWKRIAAGLYKD